MSFNIRNIREISTEPNTKFISHLAKKVSDFINEQQTQELENKEDIYSSSQQVDSVLRFHNFIMTKRFTFDVEYYPPVEPDNSGIRCWARGISLGNTLHDYSETDKTIQIYGDPMLVDGSPHDDGIVDGDTKSIALRLNRPTSGNVNEEYLQILSEGTTTLDIVGTTTGKSYFIRFRPHSLATQGGHNRTIFEKTDDLTPADGVQAQITPTGNVVFRVKKSGVEYNKQSPNSSITTNTVYDIWFTYAVSGNVQHIYINNVDQTLSDPGSPTWHSDRTNEDISVFRKGEGTNGGYLYGDLYDFRVYDEQVVSAAQVGYHYTNKWTIANIPFGQVMINNYWASYQEISGGYTTTGYTTTGYTT